MSLVYTWPLLAGVTPITPPPSTVSTQPAPASLPVVRDLASDQFTNDLVVSGSDIAVVEGLSAIVQSVRYRLQFFKGEYYLDQDAGLPYFQSVLGKGFALDVVRTLFRNEIRDTEGISSLDALALDFTASSRTLAVTFSATADEQLLENITLAVSTGGTT